MNWLRTKSGIKFDFDNFTSVDINFDDISYALSRINRWSGHLDFSVANHSIFVCDLLREDGRINPIHGLLHDAHEAYIGDITYPIKLMIDSTKLSELEERLDEAIYEKAGVPLPDEKEKKIIKFYDLLSHTFESKNLPYYDEHHKYTTKRMKELNVMNKTWNLGLLHTQYSDIFMKRFNYDYSVFSPSLVEREWAYIFNWITTFNWKPTKQLEKLCSNCGAPINYYPWQVEYQNENSLHFCSIECSEDKGYML